MSQPKMWSRRFLWLKRIALGALALIVLLVASGTGYEFWARQRAHEQFPPRGRLVDIGGRHIHLDCRGKGFPTVVLEAGVDTSGSLAWSAVHDQIAAVTRTCAYDRAGIMWSDPSPMPQHADAVADDLHATLVAAGETAPFILVGHSLGGPYSMSFSRKYGGQVAGLVFVDASHPDQMARFKAARIDVLSAITPSPRVKLMAWLTWVGWTRLPALHNTLPSHRAMPNFPARAAMAARAYAATSMPASLAEREALDESLAQAGALRSLGARPLIVLTAMKPYPEDALKSLKMSRADATRMQSLWKRLHEDEASWSTRSRHQLVPDSTHYIQFYRPDVVIAAVKEVIRTVRADNSGRTVP